MTVIEQIPRYGILPTFTGLINLLYNLITYWVLKTRSSTALGLLLEELRNRGFEITNIGPDTFEAFKKLSKVGVKNRAIFMLIKRADFITQESAKLINKLFEKRKPKKPATFYFYNIVLITENGVTEDALRYIRKKMYDSWNLRPVMPWDLLGTSFTKVTHIVNVNEKRVVYPFSDSRIKDLQRFMHREVIEVLLDFIERLNSMEN